MSRFWQGVKILSLFLPLFVVASVPAFLMEYQSAGVLNEVVLYSVNTVALETGPGAEPEGQTRSIWDRIHLIAHAPAQVQSVGYADLQRDEGLRLEMEAQLRQMQTLGALPEFSLSDFVSASFAQRTYMDPEEPEQAVSVWVINAKYEGVAVGVCMDAETWALYDVFVNAEPGVSLVYGAEDPQEGLLAYLNLFGESAPPGEEVPMNCSYGEDKVYLSLSGATTRAREYMDLEGLTWVKK